MERIVQNSMETDRTQWNVLETTCIVQARARLTPTLTHVVTYELVTSGAEDDAMSPKVKQVEIYFMVRNEPPDVKIKEQEHVPIAIQ